MPRTVRTVNDISRTGIVDPTGTAVDVANGDEVPNDGRVFLRVRASGASPRTLTVAINQTVDGQAVAARSYSIAAGVTRFIGPFDTSTYGTALAVNGDNAELILTAFRISF